MENLEKIYEKWLVGDGGTNTYLDYPAFVRAAEEVAAIEREECARIFDGYTKPRLLMTTTCADKIRNRV